MKTNLPISLLLLIAQSTVKEAFWMRKVWGESTSSEKAHLFSILRVKLIMSVNFDVNPFDTINLT